MSEAEVCADVAVLGGGTAGALVAARILEADSNARVVVVEAGPDYGPHAAGQWPSDLLDAITLPLTHDWGLRGPGPTSDLTFERAKVIGGCSAHNGCSQSIGVRADYEALGLEWRPGEFEERAARLARALRITQTPDEEVTPLQAAVLEGLMGLGVPRTDDLLDPDGGPGCGVTPVSAPDGVRWNSAFAFLDPVRDSDRLTVLDGALVDRVELDADRVTRAVAWRAGVRVDVLAQQFVLSAGTYGSPSVLLRSGIGGPRQLEALEIGIAVELDGVGKNLHDHPTCEIRFRPNDALVRATTSFARDHRVPEEQVIAKTASGQGPSPYDLHVFPYTENVAGETEVVLPVALLSPRSRGSLRLASVEPWTAPIIDHRYLTDDAQTDRSALDAGADQLDALAAAPAVRAMLGDRLTTANGDEARHGHYWHPVGTCAIGPADRGGVVDRHGRVHGVQNLRVIDASVFPAVPRATTNFPVLIVADRLTDDFLAQTTDSQLARENR